MLDKVVLVILITGFTAFVFILWIAIDFCLYRKKRAAVRAAKADAFYRKGRTERLTQPYQNDGKKKKGEKAKNKTQSKRLSVRKFVNFFSGKKKDAAPNKKGLANPASAAVSFTSQTLKEEPGINTRQSLKQESEEITIKTLVNVSANVNSSDTDKTDQHSSFKEEISVSDKVSSAPNLKGKWGNAVGQSGIPPSKKSLPPLKRNSSKTLKEANKGNCTEEVKAEGTEEDSAKTSKGEIEMKEIRQYTKKAQKKMNGSKAKVKVENEVSSSGSEQSGSESGKPNKYFSKKPSVLKRFSRNRVNSVNDGSTSSTDTKETFVDEKASVASSWTGDEDRKTTGSCSDSTNSSGSIEHDKRKFRLNPLKRNQSNMSISDTTPLT